MGKTSASVKNRWNAKNYDRITIVVPKGQKEAIREAAGAAGQSVNAYIYEAVQDRMKKEAPPEAREQPTDGEKPPGGCTPIPRILYK